MRGLLDEGGRVLVVEGEPGIGKTALWRDGVAQARRRGFRVLVATGVGSETPLSFAALRDLVDDVFDEVVDALPSPQRRALAVALQREDPGERPPEGLAVAAALLTVVRALVERGPTLLAVDDLQWLDTASSISVGYALRRVADPAFAALLTLRTEGDRATAIRRSVPPADVLALGPLTIGALGKLLATRLGLVYPRPALRRLHEVSGGNPFFALELARTVDPDAPAAPDEPVRVPATLGELVRERLAALPASTLDRLVELAALSEPPTAGAADGALAPALAAGVLVLEGGRLRFSHPLLAAAVYADADPTQRRRLHRHLARRSTSSDERARHLALSAEAPDADVAAAIAQAAQETLVRGAPAAAAGLFERAAELTPSGEEEAWAERVFAAAVAQHRAGDSIRAIALAGDAVARLAAGHARAAILAWLADVEHSVEFADRALAESGSDFRLRARALNARSESALVTGDVRGALADARGALDVAHAAGDAQLVSRAEAHVGFLEYESGEAAGLERLVHATKQEHTSIETVPYGPSIGLAVVRLWRDELDDARTLLAQQASVAEEYGHEPARAEILFLLALVELRGGRWERARSLIDEASELKRQSAHGALRQVFPERALVAAHLGELDAAREEAREFLALVSESGKRLMTVRARSLLGFVELSAGDHVAAAEQLADLPRIAGELGVAVTAAWTFPADDLDALVGADRLEQAEARIGALEAEGQEHDRARELVAAWRARGLLLAARGDAEGGLAWLERALAEHERLPVPFERGRTLLALGQVARRARRKRAAREALEAAVALFEELGARPWAEQARAELARVGGRAPSGRELTPAERRVAELAAEGKTNREIAAVAFVTPKTVEFHLHNAYAKLGVRSRTELARVFASGKD